LIAIATIYPSLVFGIHHLEEGPVMGNPDTGYSVTISFELTRTYGTVVTTCPP